MSTFLLILLILLPLSNAERLQNEFDNDHELMIQRSEAARYLFGLPIRRYQHQLLNSPMDSLSLLVDSNKDDQQRTKRIYWENLAFHVTDFNQKAKKPARSE